MARFIGIDTSCYTTSVAVYDSQQGLVAEERTVLKVKAGHGAFLNLKWCISMYVIFQNYFIRLEMRFTPSAG